MTEQAITAAQMRAKDQFTINQIGIPSLVLMERPRSPFVTPF